MTISKLRHRITAAVALTALTALSACGGASPDEKSPTSPEGSVEISVLPPIAQPGDQPADAEDAQGVVSARFGESSAGREVRVEAKSSGSWKEVGTAEVGTDGSVDFPVDGGSTSYRVVAEASDDLPAATSAEVDARAWAEPELDEAFDGDALSAAWSHRGAEYNPEGLRRCSKGSPQAVEVGGGIAQLQVKDDPARDDSCEALAADGESLGTFDYRLNGHIVSNSFYTYGVTAARIKFPRERGQHGSFWFQSSTAVGEDAKSAGAEIDVIEYFGESKDDRLASFVYYPTTDGPVKEGDWIEDASRFLADQDDEWWSDYHVFALNWTEDEYVIYIDGQEAWRTSEGVSGQPEVVVLSLLSSDYELPNLPKGALPQAMSIDWVRHWQPAGG